MMTNLFSMFDPYNFYMSSAWLIPNLIILSPILLIKSKYQKMFSLGFNEVWKEIKTSAKSVKKTWFIMPIFLLFLMSNLASMIPSNFTLTAQFSLVFPIGMICWLSIFMRNLFNNPNKTLTHLVPQGSPLILSPFLVLIELTSNMIRPITISVRLVANMTAGHILMGLLSEFICLMYPISISIIVIFIVLVMLEIMVCIIQAYIFSSLLALFSSEV